MITKILEFALKAHDGQPRKGTKIPYIVHPIETAMILAQNGASQAVIIAGILHDVLEDTLETEESILGILSDGSDKAEHILEIVCAVTEPLKLEAKRKKIPISSEKESWRERKEHTISHVKSLTGDESKKDIMLVICADKVSNIRAMVHDYEELLRKENSGMGLFGRFNAPYLDQKWYYETLVEGLKDLEEFQMYQEFKQHVSYLFRPK